MVKGQCCKLRVFQPCIFQRNIWHLTDSGREPLSAWNILPSKSISEYLGSWVTPDSLVCANNVIYRDFFFVFLGFRAMLLQFELETKKLQSITWVPHVYVTKPLDTKAPVSFSHWQYFPCVVRHSSLLCEPSTVHITPPGEDNLKVVSVFSWAPL